MNRLKTAIALLLVAIAPSSVLAAGSVCPLYEMGAWNGRWYYYCTVIPATGSQCGGTAVMGSDVTQHPLGCNDPTCVSPIGTGGTDGEKHEAVSRIPGTDETVQPYFSRDFVKFRADFVCRAKLGNGACAATPVVNLERDVRVIIMTDERVRDASGNLIPLIVAQELATNVGSGNPATADCFGGANVWKLTIPKNHVLAGWEDVSDSQSRRLRNFYARGSDVECISIMKDDRVAVDEKK